jgi:hypothetical protein
MSFTLKQFQSLPREVRHAIVIHDYRAIRHGERKLVKTQLPPSAYGTAAKATR